MTCAVSRCNRVCYDKERVYRWLLRPGATFIASVAASGGAKINQNTLSQATQILLHPVFCRVTHTGGADGAGRREGDVHFQGT